jgi:hypothetical protein
MTRATRVTFAVLVLWLLAGCSGIPNLDRGSAGCQNATGIGQVPPPADPPNVVGAEATPEIAALLIGKTPGAAAAIARGQGHTVVFNVQIEGFGECWCEVPPMGTVASVWFNSHGALFLGVDGVDVGHTPDDQPFAGWGC